MFKKMVCVAVVAISSISSTSAEAVDIGGKNHRVTAVVGAAVGGAYYGPAGAVAGYAVGHQTEAELINLRKKGISANKPIKLPKPIKVPKRFGF